MNVKQKLIVVWANTLPYEPPPGWKIVKYELIRTDDQYTIAVFVLLESIGLVGE